MQKFICFLLVVALGSFGAWWPASHHIVQTERGVIVLQKRFLTYDDTYVDARPFTSADYDNHPELKRAMIDGGYRDLLSDLKTQEMKAQLAQARDHAQAAAEEIAALVKQTVDSWLDQMSDAMGTSNKDSGASATNPPSAAAP